MTNQEIVKRRNEALAERRAKANARRNGHVLTEEEKTAARTEGTYTQKATLPPEKQIDPVAAAALAVTVLGDD